jgi:hypothetical protein
MGDSLPIGSVDQKVNESTIGDEGTIHDRDGGTHAQSGGWAHILFLGRVVADGALKGKGNIRLDAVSRDTRTPEAYFLLRAEGQV